LNDPVIHQLNPVFLSPFKPNLHGFQYLTHPLHPSLYPSRQSNGDLDQAAKGTTFCGIRALPDLACNFPEHDLSAFVPQFFKIECNKLSSLQNPGFPLMAGLAFLIWTIGLSRQRFD
jgi:hypothetical protein